MTKKSPAKTHSPKKSPAKKSPKKSPSKKSPSKKSPKKSPKHHSPKAKKSSKKKHGSKKKTTRKSRGFMNTLNRIITAEGTTKAGNRVYSYVSRLVLNEIAINSIKEITHSAVEMSQKAKRSRVLARDMEFATQTFLNGETVAAGREAVTNFTNSKSKSSKRQSSSSRAKITFPVGRVHAMVRKLVPKGVSFTASVFLATVVQCFIVAIVNAADECTPHGKRIESVSIRRALFSPLSSDTGFPMLKHKDTVKGRAQHEADVKTRESQEVTGEHIFELRDMYFGRSLVSEDMVISVVRKVPRKPATTAGAKPKKSSKKKSSKKKSSKKKPSKKGGKRKGSAKKSPAKKKAKTADIETTIKVDVHGDPKTHKVVIDKVKTLFSPRRTGKTKPYSAKGFKAALKKPISKKGSKKGSKK